MHNVTEKVLVIRREKFADVSQIKFIAKFNTSTTVALHKTDNIKIFSRMLPFSVYGGKSLQNRRKKQKTSLYFSANWYTIATVVLRREREKLIQFPFKWW